MSTLFINEIHYDNAGTDTGEFVEVAGSTGLDLSGFSLEFYNGSNGSLYALRGLSGTLADQTGTGWGFTLVGLPGIQNGSPDGIALVNGNIVVEFISYEGSFTAGEGTAAGLTSVDIGVSEGLSTPIGFSLQLQGSGNSRSEFSWSGPLAETPGAINIDQSFLPIEVPAVPLPAAFPLLVVGIVAIGTLRCLAKGVQSSVGKTIS